MKERTGGEKGYLRSFCYFTPEGNRSEGLFGISQDAKLAS